jgi:hypothetical protein
VNRRTSDRFHTKVIIAGVEPSIQVRYRASKVKQYFKEARARLPCTPLNRGSAVSYRTTRVSWLAGSTRPHGGVLRPVIMG